MLKGPSLYGPITLLTQSFILFPSELLAANDQLTDVLVKYDEAVARHSPSSTHFSPDAPVATSEGSLIDLGGSGDSAPTGETCWLERRRIRVCSAVQGSAGTLSTLREETATWHANDLGRNAWGRRMTCVHARESNKQAM